MTEEDKAAERRRRLRAALDGVKLTPEVTKDEVADPRESQNNSRDNEFLTNRPPHHGDK
ncbi:MAG: hypothetical protein RL441_1199 [Actinomycetota bacterium]